MSKTILVNIVAGSMCVLGLWLVDTGGYYRGYKHGIADSETTELLDQCMAFVRETDTDLAMLVEKIKTQCRH